jgi:type I restriction-modification system DNA methylase subunit
VKNPRRAGTQRKNIATDNLARMNMLLHGVKDSEFEIYHGDTLPTIGTSCGG